MRLPDDLWSLFCGTAAVVLCTAGCGSEPPAPPPVPVPEAAPTVEIPEEGEQVAPAPPAARDEQPAAEEEAEESAPAAADSTPAAEPPAAAPESATSDSAEAAAPARVLLGSPELTAGIPGDGPLTVDQIQKWLANDANHVPLQIDLPLGLKAGQGEIKGLDANPMTRAKIELGRQLYFDTRLSADNTISCASCHDPAEGFARHTQFGVGIDGQEGGRNSPVSYNRILSDLQFWDGRAASLEQQAVGPIANPIEMGNTHEKVVETVKGIEGYRSQFERIFPDHGVTIDAIGLAIATFERAIVTGPTPADYYEIVQAVQAQYDDEEIAALEKEEPELHEKYLAALAGSESMSESAVRGRALFFSDKASCTACHVGANFSDEKYHNLGIGMDKEEPDVGRAEVTGEEQDRGAFKTPTIRNVALSAPYMHDGSLATLAEVVEWYDDGGHANEHLSDKITTRRKPIW